MRIALPLLLLAISGCAQTPRPPLVPRFETVYDCSEKQVTPAGRFEADVETVRWNRDLGGGITTGYSVDLYTDQMRTDFATKGFAVAANVDHPVTFFDFDRNLDALNQGPDGHWKSMLTGWLRFGTRTVKAPMPSNMTMAIWWTQSKQLLATGGEVTVTLTDPAGKLHQQATLPAADWLQSEAVLMAMHAKVMTKLADKEHLCPSRQEEVLDPIVMVG